MRRTWRPALAIEVSVAHGPRSIGHSAHFPTTLRQGSRAGWSVQANDAHSYRPQDGLGAVARLELLVNRRQVVLDRLHTDVELAGHLGGRQPVGHELEHLFFPFGDD